jgi:hypothetical protein
MKLGDFSSLVQLGVGLHAGTALLQSVTEFAGTPLSRRIERLRTLAELKAKRDPKYDDCLESAANLLGTLEVKKIQFFNEYKEVAKANGGVAIALCFLLAVQAFLADQCIPISVGLFIVALSLFPAGGSLYFLHSRWATNVKSLVEGVKKLNEQLFSSR